MKNEIRIRIGKRVGDVFDLMAKGERATAIEQVMLAVAATSRKTYRKERSDRKRFVDFVNSNKDVVMRTALPSLENCTIRLGCGHPELQRKVKSPDGCYAIEDILYQIRCDLIHEGEPPIDFQLVTELKIGGPDPFLVPESTIYGLLMAVVVAPVNSLEYLPPHYGLTVSNSTAKINDFWGQKQKFVDWFDAARESPPPSAAAECTDTE